MTSVTVHHGDSRDVLKSLADNSVDSCVCDPPYALVSIHKRFAKTGRTPSTMPKSGPHARASAGFMGQKWDTGETAFDPEFWAEVYRVLKPGAHLIAFSGTRTYHRMTCAIEDAGFEVRDQIGWAYGSGFPKSHNQKGEWDGWGTALKPAWEPICVARKPLVGTVAENLRQWGVGALNIDGCRIETCDPLAVPDGRRTISEVHEGYQRPGLSMFENKSAIRGGPSNALGRWPANVIHDGSEEVRAAFPESDGDQGRVTGAEPSTDDRRILSGLAGRHPPREPRNDAGSAARFFYSAKADAEDRLGSKHPTVKPVDLMQWLCRLVTPPGGVVLDPFAGSGSTGLAAMNEGFDCILIEREERFVADINRRLAWARGEGRLTALELARDIKPEEAAGADLPLFSGDAA